MANYHVPLYDRACSVFQRRFKQVYFQLNPFLERTNVKDDEAESYQPSSKFVIPLQSIVVCEQIDQDGAREWKVLKPDQFWEYLYSDAWDNECSLRVLEGELLELLMMVLCTMEKEDEVVSHLTFGYAKNMRRVHKCYINSQKEDEFIEETLLIEFIYYGIRQRKPFRGKDANLAAVNWRDYKDLAAKAAGVTKLADLVDILSQKTSSNKKNESFFSLIRPVKSNRTASDNDKSIRIESLTAMKWQETWRNSRRRTIASERDVSPFERPLSNISEDGGELLAKMDEMLFDKSKRAGRQRRNATFFSDMLGRYVPPGDEFYINKLKPQNKMGVTTEELLRAKKSEKEKERELEMQKLKELSDRMKRVNLCSFDDSLVISSASSPDQPFVKLYQRKPSFGNFFKYLEDESKFESRFKKSMQRKKKLLDKSKLKEKKESKLSLSVDDKKTQGIRSNVVLTGKTSAVSGLGKQVARTHSKKIVADRHRFASEVGGVTDSQAAKRHCLNYVSSFHKQEEHVPKINRGRVRNTYITTITSPILEGSSRSESRSASTQSRARSRNVYSKTTSYEDSDRESDSSDSIYDDDEVDDFKDTVFNTKKLNKSFSIEKIRSIKSKKEKKPPVLNILRKFCKVNRMMNNLGQKPSKTPRKSVAEMNRAKQSKKAFGMFRRLNEAAGSMAEAKPTVVIGKLKDFGFLKFKNYQMKEPDVVPPCFDKFSVDAFKANLARALDDFVIRKEKITTSHTFETLTTITFTRPAAYVRMHQIPKDP